MKKMKLRPVYKKMVVGGTTDLNDPDTFSGPVTTNGPVDAGLSGTGNQFAWAPDTTKQGLSTGFSSGRSIDWNGILNGVAKVGEAAAPYASNIANAFRRPPMPNQPGMVNPVVLSRINLSNAKNSILRQTHTADAQANKYLDPQSAAAARVANLSKGIEGTSQVAEQEAFLNSRQQAEAAGMNLNVNAMNVGAMNHYRDTLTERNIAGQREQSANLANATDKYIGINNEKAKADLDLKKIGVLSQMWRDSGVYDRMLGKMKKQGIDDPTGILQQREGFQDGGIMQHNYDAISIPKAYGGRVFADGGPIKTSLVDDVNHVVSSGNIPRGPQLTTYSPDERNLLQDAYIWSQRPDMVGKNPEQRIQGYYGRPVTSSPVDMLRQGLSTVGQGPLNMLNTDTDITTQARQGSSASITKGVMGQAPMAFGGFNPATKPFGMPRGAATGRSAISPFGASRTIGLGAHIPNGKANVRGSIARGYKMMQDGGGVGMDTPDDIFKENQHNVMAKGGWIKKAVNPAHKGYCTPMTKSTCTPRRKAFAMTMKKHHGFH